VLFYVSWKNRAGQDPEGLEAGLEVFSRWEPPAGFECKGMTWAGNPVNWHMNQQASRSDVGY
jgi:hypothetical protein